MTPYVMTFYAMTFYVMASYVMALLRYGVTRVATSVGDRNYSAPNRPQTCGPPLTETLLCRVGLSSAGAEPPEADLGDRKSEVRNGAELGVHRHGLRGPESPLPSASSASLGSSPCFQGVRGFTYLDSGSVTAPRK